VYGGDASEEEKLLEKAEGRQEKRMKQVGNVENPPGSLLAVLKVDN